MSRTPATTLRCLGLCIIGFLDCARLRAVDAELVARAEAGLQRVTEYLTTKVAVGGGYLGTYTADLSDQWGETHATRSQNWIQPPGCPSVGQAFLLAWQATGDRRYLEAATQVARALVSGQLECGGWDYIVDHSPEGARNWYYRRNRNCEDPSLKTGRNQATFDDDTSQSATRLLIGVDTALERQDPAIHEATMAALEFILKAQHESGGWPQRYPPAGRGYGDFFTFNDNTIADLADTMILAHRTYGDERYAGALLRCGDFIVKVQLPAPQATWAQQYDFDLKPAWARKFEPPAACGGESLGVMRLLIKIAIFSGDSKYLAPLPGALDWFQRSRSPDGNWARFYELKTNRPLYFTKDSYWMTLSDADMPTHYCFRDNWDPAPVARTHAEIQKNGLAHYKQKREPKVPTEAQRQKAAAALEPKVRKVLEAQDADGRWVTTSGGEMPAGAARLDMGTFERNMKVLSDYIKLAKGR